MTDSKSLFELAQLAEASYAEFNLFANVEDALKNKKFSDTQATEFVKNWQVVSHQPNTDSGFSATLFKYIGNDPDSGFQNGQYVFSVRGTEPDSFVDSLDLYEDIFNIVADGLAINQIVDLYNYWKWITTPVGQTYQVAKLVDLVEGGDPTKVLVERFGGYSTIEFVDSTIAYPSGDPYTVGLGLESAISTAGLDVTGHSLGGHMAAAFTRLFPQFNATATTINGAGFATTGPLGGVSGTAQINIANLFGMLGGTNNFGNIQNVYGDKMLEIVTQDGPLLYQQGEHDTLFIEQDGFFDNTLGHGSSQMTNSLAVANLLIRLDSTLASQTSAQALSRLNTIFESASNQAELSLENLVAELTQIVMGGSKPDIAIDDRESLYVAIYNLWNSERSINPSSEKLKSLRHLPQLVKHAAILVHF